MKRKGNSDTPNVLTQEVSDSFPSVAGNKAKSLGPEENGMWPEGLKECLNRIWTGNSSRILFQYTTRYRGE